MEFLSEGKSCGFKNSWIRGRGLTGRCGKTGEHKVGENTQWQNHRLADRGTHGKGLNEITVSLTTSFHDETRQETRMGTENLHAVQSTKEIKRKFRKLVFKVAEHSFQVPMPNSP